MPAVALALFAVFIALGFGWRSWAQYRATGSTGFKGVSGRPGSVEWFAGVGFVVAIVIGLAAPLLQWAGVLTPLVNAAWVNVSGVAIAVCGIAATVYAQLDMGDSWRIGVDRTETTSLVHDGVFAWVRSPIFSAMIVFSIGAALVTPNPLAVAAVLLLVATIELQVRRVEEPYLLTVHGDPYRTYLATVGRFIPHLGTSGSAA